MKSNASRVQEGDVFSRTSFGTVVDRCNGNVVVRNSDNFEWTVSDAVFEAEFTVATQAADEKIVSQTELIQEIMKNPQIAITIHFRKKVKPVEVVAAIRNWLGPGNPGPETRRFSDFVKEQLAGEPRTMIGRHFCDLDDHQRLRFVEHGKGLRLVDPRTVEYAIIRGVRYSTS